MLLNTNKKRNIIEESGGDDEVNRIQRNTGMDSMSRHMGETHRVGEMKLMQGALEHRQPGDSCTGMLGKNEIMGKRENQQEGNFQSQKINKRNGRSSERGGNFKRVEEEIIRDLEEMSCKEKINGPQNQMETEIESNESGPRAEMTKPRKKKWKYQAWNVEGRRGIK